ncbi:MarR family transcriptional regulator [Ktedonosporobacter rubrisoli]|uniref:MarR family transcriptional regulator n=1 Tax=Ktedonosporobacter rubrisoli TaxID=2509675 RepID=A0A4P6JW37_KTERU|nr:MarR family transcriptional regulator [Ktedonosporobacter rubrisoli]QBD79899.1 MarR family transcriptional regulator [Ktedonosporobacter rubrisoli]
MPGHVRERSEIIGDLHEELRQLSLDAVVFGQVVADRLGINAGDLECLGILSRVGPVTAGQLAGLTGLSTGAVTGLVDRLEKAGYVRRWRDQEDRRRVIIQLVREKALQEIEPLFGSLARVIKEHSALYSDEELELFLRFISGTNQQMHEQISRLRREEH